MKATIDLDDTLYRQLKAEAALRGRKVEELVAEGVRRVLADPLSPSSPLPATDSTAKPAWFGSLHKYAKNAAGRHDLTSMRASVARGRRADD